MLQKGRLLGHKKFGSKKFSTEYVQTSKSSELDWIDFQPPKLTMKAKDILNRQKVLHGIKRQPKEVKVDWISPALLNNS